MMGRMNAELAAFIRDELGADTPWHISGFHGAHLMINHPDTPLATLETTWSIGRQVGLQYVVHRQCPQRFGHGAHFARVRELYWI